jgi:lipopolysaccharide transport system permease protein
MTPVDAEKWTTVIKPTSGLLDVNFKELVRYRDLWRMFVKRNIVTQYKQTILGPLWFFINPALTTVIYMVVFGGIAGISTDGLPQPLFYLAGICLWNYFSTCLNQTSSTFVTNQAIFGKVYFPRLVMPLSTVTSSLFTLGIQLLLFVVVYLF